jgi:hypothetical protein
MSTYSFLNVVGTLTGPGGAISIGSGSGDAEEGITTEMIEEKDLMTVGADGSIMHSLRASNAARMTVRLLKTSPINAQLSTLYNFQRQASGTWGQNVIVVADTQRGDVLSLTQCAFARQPVITYAKDGNFNEWLFLGALNELLGSGVPDLNT